MTFIRKKLAVIGDPISHSLSPQMHNAAINYLKLGLNYSAIQVKQENIKNFLDSAKETHLGFNVTVPNKIEIIKYLDEISETAKICNSVNTVKIQDNGKTSGYSTDGYGLEMALKELFGINPINNSFLFTGCGGAAQAAAAHILKNGAESVCFLNRTLYKAKNFVNRLKSHFNKNEILALSYNDDSLIENYLSRNPVIVQSTSLGLQDTDPLIFPEKYFRKNLYYFDMIYKDTKFLQTARANGAITGNGMLMLLYQGVKSFSIWTNIEPPINIMRIALENSMNHINQK